jgi:hypothetical protein
MSYQSPLHILKSLNLSPDDLDSDNLNRLRKKLLAEFNLTHEITIEINDVKYTKDEILKSIDKLKEIDDFAVHKAIFERKMLLNWMENPKNKPFAASEAKNVLEKYVEIDWLNENIKKGLLIHISHCYKNKEFPKITQLLPVVYLLKEAYRYDVWDVLYDCLTSTIEQIKYAVKLPNVYKNKVQFGYISHSYWTDFLNALPNGFQDLINSYIVYTANYIVKIQNHDTEFAYDVSYQLCQTYCTNAKTKRAIQENHAIFEASVSTVEAPSSTGFGCSFWIAMTVIIFILAILFIVGSKTR